MKQHEYVVIKSMIFCSYILKHVMFLGFTGLKFQTILFKVMPLRMSVVSVEMFSDLVQLLLAF